ELHFNTAAIGLHAARSGVERRVRDLDFLRIARKPVNPSSRAWRNGSPPGGWLAPRRGPRLSAAGPCRCRRLAAAARRWLRGHAWNDKRRIPERLPLVLLDDVRRDVDSQVDQWSSL